MKKLLAVALLTLSLGGCASLQNDWDILTNTSVSPQQILVAANSFDAVEITAANYLAWCKANATQTACALSTRKTVAAAVRAGISARATLEPFVTAGTAGPVAIYNALVAAVTTLQSTTPVTGN